MFEESIYNQVFNEKEFSKLQYNVLPLLTLVVCGI